MNLKKSVSTESVKSISTVSCVNVCPARQIGSENAKSNVETNTINRITLRRQMRLSRTTRIKRRSTSANRRYAIATVIPMNTLAVQACTTTPASPTDGVTAKMAEDKTRVNPGNTCSGGRNPAATDISIHADG